ncbi:hypothetical protein [Streptosporangium subroseum]|nr:hypothetical protein OHB15_18460 [Streptosporangium subroseum]
MDDHRQAAPYVCRPDEPPSGDDTVRPATAGGMPLITATCGASS